MSDPYNLIDRFLRNNLCDSDYEEYSQALIELSSPPPAITVDDLVDAYESGWIQASNWANRTDLIADMNSPAYLRDRSVRVPLFADMIASHPGLAEELKELDAEVDREFGIPPSSKT